MFRFLVSEKFRQEYSKEFRCKLEVEQELVEAAYKEVEKDSVSN